MDGGGRRRGQGDVMYELIACLLLVVCMLLVLKTQKEVKEPRNVDSL